MMIDLELCRKSSRIPTRRSRAYWSVVDSVWKRPPGFQTGRGWAQELARASSGASERRRDRSSTAPRSRDASGARIDRASNHWSRSRGSGVPGRKRVGSGEHLSAHREPWPAACSAPPCCGRCSPCSRSWRPRVRPQIARRPSSATRAIFAEPTVRRVARFRRLSTLASAARPEKMTAPAPSPPPLADSVAPNFYSGYPVTSDVTGSAFKLKFKVRPVSPPRRHPLASIAARVALSFSLSSPTDAR